MRLNSSSVVPLILLVVHTGCGREGTAYAARRSGASARAVPPDSQQVGTRSRPDVSSYSGTDAHGVPHYLTRALSSSERRVLRDAFGVVSPSHLYISDSTPDGLLKYDPEPKHCSTCYVNSYRIGFVSIRKPGESWDDLERRVRTLRGSSFSPSSLVTSSSVTAMDPEVQDEARQMLDAARRAGFHPRVISTYRSPEQEAMLMARGGGRTHTLTSLHSYGRAIDISIGDGNLTNASTRRSWIAFRQWVTRFHGNDFRILGQPDRSWDWPHVELPSDRIGFRSVDDAIASGRGCLARAASRACEFLPHLPPAR